MPGQKDGRWEERKDRRMEGGKDGLTDPFHRSLLATAEGPVKKNFAIKLIKLVTENHIKNICYIHVIHKIRKILAGYIFF